jgi:hypothetical protein
MLADIQLLVMAISVCHPDHPVELTPQQLDDIRAQFDWLGPYHFAKTYGVLDASKSGEDFAIKFMTAYNKFIPNTY